MKLSKHKTEAGEVAYQFRALLLLQRTQPQFPVSTPGSSQPPVTPASGKLTPVASPATCTHARVHTQFKIIVSIFFKKKDTKQKNKAIQFTVLWSILTFS